MSNQKVAILVAVFLSAFFGATAGPLRTQTQNPPTAAGSDQQPASPPSVVQHVPLTDEEAAELHLARKEFPEAVASFRKLSEKYPSNASYPNKMGIAYLQEGLFGQAKKAFDRALKINPHYAEAQNNIGALWDQQGKYGKAIKAYRKALEMNPQSAVTYSNLGTAYVSEKRYEEAIAAFRQAFQIDPQVFDHRGGSSATFLQNRSSSDHGQFYFLLAKSYAQVGNVANCMHYLRKAKDEGYKYMDSVKTDPSFAALLANPELEEILAPAEADTAKP